MRVLHAFCHHTYIILIHFHWLLLLESVLRSLLYCFAFCGNQLFKFHRNSNDWLPHDVGSGCGKSRKRLLTVLYLFFFYFLVLYFDIVPSWVFFEYVSCTHFRWYLINFNRPFNLNIKFLNLTSFHICCFYSTFNCSFVFLELFMLI